MHPGSSTVAWGGAMMKKAALVRLVLSLLAIGLTCGSGYAQANQIAVSADIPFSFTVQNTMLPAGKYEFVRSDADTWEFTVVNASGDTKVIFLTEPTDVPMASKLSELVFDVYGDKYFLSRINVDGEMGGFYLSKTSSERAYMKKEGMKTQKVPAKKR